MPIQISILATEGGGAVKSGRLPQILLISSLLVLPFRLSAAPGTLVDNPLFLQQGVQPNIFFILDDSGSMDWEVVKSRGAEQVHPSPKSPNGGNLDFTPEGAGDDNDEPYNWWVNDYTEEDDGNEEENERLELCVGYNVLMYDPDVVYTPWQGEDHNRVAFQDQDDPTSVHVNPYIGGSAGDGDCGDGYVDNDNGALTCDLVDGFGNGEGAFYYPWNDQAEGDAGHNVYEDGECDTTPVFVSTLSAADQTNFANWFSYYRKREYVVKRAVSQIIKESQARMGLATINRSRRVLDSTLPSLNRQEAGTPIADIDDITAPIDTDAQSNKQILMDNLLAVNSNGATPLRRALENTGLYFQGAMNNGNLFDFTPPDVTGSANGSSPIMNLANGGQCQQNFALLFSDGYWNGSSPSVGNTDKSGGTYDGGSYADDEEDVENTLADVAMHYYETDLISGLADKVPKVTIEAGVDDNPQQHLVTYTIAFGVSGSVTSNPTDRAASFAWPTPVEDTPSTVDDMRHAAWNGRGQFMSAAHPQELIEQLQAVIEDIDRRSATAAAAVAINAGHLQAGNLIYQAKFNSTRWSGELTASELMLNSNGTYDFTLQWEAHALLNSRDISLRTIITYDGTQGVNFEFSNLALLQVADLLYGDPHIDLGLTEAVYGESLVAYLRGSFVDEEGADPLFRSRGGNRLGDIVHSSPLYVGAPYPLRYPDSIEGADSYRNWANQADIKNRTPMLYIGSNGGMLHAFEAETGVERFAYIPHAVFSAEEKAGLHWLADKAYEHRFYVDQTPTVMDVFIANPPETEKWRTVLVGGLRGGGKALYALDVTDPDEFDNPSTAVGNVLWEFTHDDLGYTFSQPAIVKLNNGKWAAIFGNGYNNDLSADNSINGDGKAKLFIVDLATGALVGGNPLTTNAGGIANSSCIDPGSDCNGLATPAVIDTTGDGVIDRVYAGDLKGNMWVFDLSDADSSQWGLAHGTVPLFTAKDTSNNSQPITTRPRLAMHPTKKSLTTKPNIMVYFGTGQYLVGSDIENTAEQSFYAIWDSGTATARGDLLEQIISVPETDRRILTDKPITYGTASGERRGWFVDLTESGERVVVTPLLYGKLVAYTTITPNSEVCGSAGTSWLMVHDLTDGGRPDFIALDVDNNGEFDEQDKVGGINVSGVRSGNLQWQPTIVATDKIALPTDEQGIVLQGLTSGNDQPQRASWARFDF